MAKYPDRRSAAIPALAAAQRQHGWCSPEAIEQAACVMRLTPGYLVSVASFYDMLDTRAGRPPRGLRLHEHLVLAVRRRRAVRAPPARRSPTDPDFNVRHFECLGACDIAPMASVDGVYVGPIELDDVPILVEQIREGSRRCPASSCACARAPTRSAASAQTDDR